MSKLEELIQGLCPNGVTYKKLENVCTFYRGSSITSRNAQYGSIPVISGGKKPAFYHNIANRPANTITVAGSGAYAGFVAFWKEEIFCADSFSVDIKDETTLDKRYLYHFLLNNQAEIYKKKTGGGIPHVHGKDIANFRIPVPPLPVQREIVRILDQFTELTGELTAELTARRKQYEYYRDKLLAFNLSSVQWLTLGDIGSVSMCKRIMKSETSPSGDVPFYKIGTFGGIANAYISKETFEKYKANYSYPKKGDILISAAGTIGKTVIFDGQPSYFQDSNIVWIDNNENLVYNKFLYYYYQLQPWHVSTGGTIARIYNDNISRAKIPIPSLEEQERIIAILDRFDALCNDITAGLPAEIEARQKQYEYYRDKLLTFKEKVN